MLANLSNRFRVPAIFWAKVAQEASGFFGCQDYRAEDGAQGYSMYHKIVLWRKTLTKEAPFSDFSSKK
jgi:hypothetical protein